jgi:iron complex outermembrane receptor protein
MNASSNRTQVSSFGALLIAAAVALPFTYTAPALAQGAGLEEIVVTARKREESLMETPVSITAFSTDELTAMNVSSVDMIAEQTPNLVFDSTSNISGSSNSASIFIRGIGQRDYTLAVEPGVGIYIDDVYLAHSLGNVLDVVDVERIEVLRGPQGTLFGRNTIGGAIRVVTKKPTEEFEGMAELTIGELDRRDIKAQLNIPLNDELFFRISGLSQQRDGYVDQPLLNRKTGDRDSNSVVGQLRWVPRDDFTLDFMVTDVRDRSNGAAMVLLTADEVPPDGSGPQRFADQVAPEIADVDPTVLDFLLGPEFIGWDGDECPCTDFSDTAIPQSLDTTSLALTLDWEINDALALKSITGFRTLETDFGRDGDHVPYAQQVELFFFTEYDQWSQELQLSGTAFGERLNWITGLYYYTEDGQSDDFIEFATLDLLSGGEFETDTWAAYGQGTYDITDALSLTVGLRYTDEEKTTIIDGTQHQVVIAFLGSNSFKSPANPPFQVVPPGTYKDDITETEPYVNLTYNFTDDLMGYASYSEGFKGGGTQVRNGPIGFLPRFGPEKAEVFEVGAKWVLPRLRTNISAAGFFTDYSDLQITANVTPPGFQPTSVVTNAGDAEITGVEVEVQSRPTDALTINAGLAWLDAEYDDLKRDDMGNIDVPGVTLDSELPNAPEWQFNLSASYDVPTDWGLFTPRVDYSWTDEQFNDAQNNEILKRDDVHMVNLSLGYESNNGLWSGALFVTNVAEEQFVLAGFDGTFYGDGAISRPREWGLRIRRSF